MGVVYKAIRDNRAFEKAVAVKVLHLGLETPAMLERFRQERQILAGLEHPNIARLIDGGTTSAGLPYIVLEYVEGVPLTQYCEREKLPREQRLHLFLKVCDAVEYAHRKLVVHRDLKPVNILVTADGTPKLLDFGIAKLLDNSSEQTATLLQALTPDYASPEQLRGELVSTATDTYSLGIILYELLTGRRPYKIATSSPVEICRLVETAVPEEPGLGEDLDNILRMALRKEPERRYNAVRALAADIESYLDHRPVAARPDTISYRVRKFSRRYWWQLAAVCSIFALLSASLAIALAEQRRTVRRFQQVRQLANRFLFDFHDKVAKTPGTLKARAMMVATAQEYLNSLAADAKGDAGLQRELGVAYAKLAVAQGAANGPSLGHPQDAVATYDKALSLARSLDDAKALTKAQRETFVTILRDAANNRIFLRDTENALRFVREADTSSEGLPPLLRAKTLSVLASILNQRGDLAGSLRVLERLLPVTREQAASEQILENRQQIHMC